MSCWRTEEIRRAAARLVEAGDGPLPGDSAGAQEPGGTAGIGALLAHARACVRCRELLELFLRAEVELRRAETRRVIPLAPVRSARAARADAPAADPEEAPAYLMAADAGTGGAGPGGERAATPVLTLASGDGRYLVRIFPTAGGERAGAGAVAGAIAVLVGPPADAGEADPSRGPGAPLLLRVEGVDYRFGADGTATLPSFPVSPISLVLP